MLPIDLSGKRALVAGVSDDGGFGFAIAKSLAEAGATICLGSWPPALGIFTKLLERGKMEESMQLGDGRKLEFERIYPLDAAFDTLDEAPAEIRDNKRYKDFGDSSLDVVVHSLANAPEVKSPLVDTSRQGYLSAISVSAYSNVSLVRHLAPLMKEGGSFLSLSYMAGERVIPGYGGGMS
jgi:enoyl-[acyl-carrier protein] reductase I